MQRRLSLKLAIYIMLVLILIIGGSSILYASNSKSLYINSEKQIMQEAFNELKAIDFEKSKSKIDDFLEHYDSQVYDLYICDDELIPIYSTERTSLTLDIIRDRFVEKQDEYKTDNLPEYISQDKSLESIVLKARIKKNSNTYFVYLEESLRTSDSVFNYTNEFLAGILIVFIAVCGISVFILVSRTTKPLRELSDVAAKLSEGDYSVRYNGKITNDEIGVLSQNLNFMANTIAENINNLKNYNFLLKEDNSRMTEYENMRKRVLTNVTHELKTPLAIISSQIEMMTVTKDNDKKQYYYESAMEEIDKMSKLISRLLNFSAGEKVIFEDQKKLIDLDIFISNLCEKSAAIISSKQIKLETQLERCRIEFPPEHVEHIFNNYLMNALQHGKFGGLISVSVRKYDDKCRLSVFNEGSNVSIDDSEKIWTDFYKSQSITDDAKRVGIGLFIVKEISLINHDSCGFINHDNGVEFWYDFFEK